VEDTAGGVAGIVHDIYVLFWLWGMLEKVMQVMYMIYMSRSHCKWRLKGMLDVMYMLFQLWGI
jgi:hypothetical protein